MIDLSLFEWRWYSQNREDGVLDEIFYHVGTGSKYACEFGAYYDFHGSNTGYLREVQGWQGIFFDAHNCNKNINLKREHIIAENINAIFQKHHVPHDLDLLSIDIDYNDFYVWHALSQEYRPRVVVIEYNASHGPFVDKVVQYHPQYYWDKTNYFGASISALYNLGRKKGYSLVYAENTGINLFFVRDDLLNRRSIFKNTNKVEEIYRPPTYGVGPLGGHMQDPFNRPYLTSSQIL